MAARVARRGCGRACIAWLAAAFAWSGTASADVRFPAHARAGYEPPAVERHWNVAVGWARPDDTGLTGSFDSGPLLSAAIQFPQSRSLTGGVTADYAYFPTGSVSGAGVDGDAWHALHLAVDARRHLALSPEMPDLRLLLMLAAGWSHLSFGEHTIHERTGDVHHPATTLSGLTIMLGLGSEWLPQDRTGFQVDARFVLHLGDQSITWYPIRVGLLFPWGR